MDHCQCLTARPRTPSSTIPVSTAEDNVWRSSGRMERQRSSVTVPKIPLQPADRSRPQRPRRIRVDQSRPRSVPPPRPVPVGLGCLSTPQERTGGHGCDPSKRLGAGEDANRARPRRECRQATQETAAAGQGQSQRGYVACGRET